MRRNAFVCASLALATLNGCTPEGLTVTACSLDGKLAFQVHKIDGWFSDYQPRPSSVIVLAEGKGPGSDWPGMWAAELKYDSSRDKGFESRPARPLIVYGQQLPGWVVDQQAKPLERGKAYWFSTHDNGHHGGVRIVGGESPEPC